MSASGADQGLATAEPVQITAQGIGFVFGPDCRMISDIVVADQGRRIALHLSPAGITDLRHITGAIAWPSRDPVRAIRMGSDWLEVEGDGGASRALPLHADFLDISR